MRQKTETRKLAEQIQKITGESLISIYFHAMEYVQSGLIACPKQALEYILERVQEEM